jgi:hypothetical protein
VHSFSFRLFLVCLATSLVAQLPARGVEIAVTGVSIPFFNETGHLTHRLLAKRGKKSGHVQHLAEVEVHYFAAADPTLIVQKLEADDATWDERKETLVGRGRIVVATQENRLTGEGFDFALATSLLHIHRNFTMTNAEAVVTSDRAIAELVVEQSGENLKLRDVKRCEAIGNLQITVQPTAKKKYYFDKLSSDLAIYEGATRTVTLPHPVRTSQRDGGRGAFNTMNFTLGPAGDETPQP